MRGAGPAILLTICVALSGCAPTNYANPSHPGFGKVEYDRDLAECRKQNSRSVLRSGYDDTTVIEVDEPKARACMAAHGWQQ